MKISQLLSEIAEGAVTPDGQADVLGAVSTGVSHDKPHLCRSLYAELVLCRHVPG